MEEIVVGDILLKKSCCQLKRTVISINNHDVVLQNDLGDRQTVLLCQVKENFEKVDHVNINANIKNYLNAKYLESQVKRRKAEMTTLQQNIDFFENKLKQSQEKQKEFSDTCMCCLAESLFLPDCKSCSTYKESEALV